MDKIEFNNLDLTLYRETLNNGLEIYVIPKKEVNNIYVTFSTKYGSNQSEFEYENKMIKVPDGIAHFLEHKMFEQKDGIDPFTFYSERGADANANTTNEKTSYLFSGPDFFEENLNYLIDYVQSPYFTDENVEKEKGIIEQEIKMYQDDPYSRLYEGILYNSFNENPYKNSVIGTVESVNSITKEDLYKCYNTFYHPSNMFIVVTGNVNPNSVIELIKKNQENKEFKDIDKINIKSFKEKDEVFKDYEVLNMSVTIPKVTISYKINLDKIKDMSRLEKLYYLKIIFDDNFSNSSLFNEMLKEKNIINSDLEVSDIDANSHFLFTIFGETFEINKLIELIKNKISNLDITEEALERKKKVIISNNVYMSDNIQGMNHKVMSDIIKYDKVINNNCEIVRSLNIEKAKYLLKKLDLSNNTTFIIDLKK